MKTFMFNIEFNAEQKHIFREPGLPYWREPPKQSGATML